MRSTVFPIFAALLAFAFGAEENGTLSEPISNDGHGPLVQALLAPADLEKSEGPDLIREKRTFWKHGGGGGGGYCCGGGGGGYGGGGYGGHGGGNGGYGGGNYGGGYGGENYGGGCGGGNCGGGNYYQPQPVYHQPPCGGGCGGGGGGGNSYATAQASASASSWGKK